MSGTVPMPLKQSQFYKQRTVQKNYVRTPPNIYEPVPATPPTVLPQKETDYDIIRKEGIVSFAPALREQAADISAWYRDFGHYFRDTFGELMNEDDLDRILAPINNEEWRISFTHDSYNPTREKNYQIVEKLGDTVMKLAFTKFLMAQYPGQLDESEISNLSSYYLSKRQQGDISLKLGLPQFLLSQVAHSLSINEDLLEAFFGTLFNLAQKGLGRGYDISYAVLEAIYTWYPIDLMNTGGHPKSQVTQAIKGLGWGDLLEKNFEGKLKNITENKAPGGIEITLFFPEAAMRYFKSNRVAVDSRVLASGRGKTAKVANYQAYANALVKLSNLQGVNYIRMSKEKRLLDPEIAKLIAQANTVAQNLGYDELSMNSSVRDTKTTIFLHGSKGKKVHMLYGGEGDNDLYQQIQTKVLKDFIAANS